MADPLPAAKSFCRLLVANEPRKWPWRSMQRVTPQHSSWRAGALIRDEAPTHRPPLQAPYSRSRQGGSWSDASQGRRRAGLWGGQRRVVEGVAACMIQTFLSARRPSTS